MDAIKKQARKFREQVIKQQQAVLKQVSGHFGHDSCLVDETELQCYQNLQMLYASTKAAKHLQRDLVRGLEAFIAVSSKEMEIVNKLAEGCCNYGKEYESSGYALAKASIDFATSHRLMESEKDTFLRTIGVQVSEPLKAMITAAPLENARHLTFRYERIRRDVEAQIAEVVRRRLKSKEARSSAKNDDKLERAEAKLSELSTTLAAIGKEATEAMVAVEVQQQQTTFEDLLAMVAAEKVYHQNVTGILDNLHNKLALAKQHQEYSQQLAVKGTIQPLAVSDDPVSLSEKFSASFQIHKHFVAKAIHSFEAEADGELSLSVGDYIVVQQVASSGWSQGECNGKVGWFPSAFATCIEEQEKAVVSQTIDPSMLT